jgi:RNA polymerase sigma-70 factor (ECF subfamily)
MSALETVSAAVDSSGGDDVLMMLRAGDERAFLALVGRYHGSMVRVALGFVSSQAVAEEVAQEAWLGVLSGLAAFEGRSSLKSWIFRILTNCAKTRGQRERRSVPMSALGQEDEGAGPSVEPERFFDSSHPRWAGHWIVPPEHWAENRLVSAETLEVVGRAIETLPLAQRQVISLRDVEGMSAEETCALLGLSEANQRVLLHRARSRVRGLIESYMKAETAS